MTTAEKPTSNPDADTTIPVPCPVCKVAAFEPCSDPEYPKLKSHWARNDDAGKYRALVHSIAATTRGFRYKIEIYHICSRGGGGFWAESSSTEKFDEQSEGSALAVAKKLELSEYIGSGTIAVRVVREEIVYGKTQDGVERGALVKLTPWDKYDPPAQTVRLPKEI